MLANQYWSSNVDKDDLIQEGLMGLVYAAQKWRADGGCKNFLTFAKPIVVGQMLNWVRKNKTGRCKLRVSGCESMDAERGSEELTLHDLIACSCPSQESRLIEADGAEYWRERIQAALSRLPERQRRIVELHVFEGKSLEEAGAPLGLKNRRRVHQVYQDALTQLRRILRRHVTQ
jgi:RNA polymerase sigma factor (sigma-70 family)